MHHTGSELAKKPELKEESELARIPKLGEEDELAKMLELVGGGELAEKPELDKVDELTETPKLDKRGELAETPKLDEVKFVFAAVIWVALLPLQSMATTLGIIAPSNMKEGGRGHCHRQQMRRGEAYLRARWDPSCSQSTVRSHRRFRQLCLIRQGQGQQEFHGSRCVCVCFGSGSGIVRRGTF